VRFIFGCGGTGGHIYPALAVAEDLNGKGHEMLFIGNGSGMEASIISAGGYAFSPIDVRKLYRKLTPQLLTFPYHLLKSTILSVGIIRRFRPDAVFCTGGFVSGPVAAAAILTRTPLFFHESNSLPGITTKAFARFTRATFISFAASRQRLRARNMIEVGVPLMKKALHAANFDPSELGFESHKPLILVTGGSQGSAAINKAVDDAARDILNMGFGIIWQAGKTGYPALHGKYKDTRDIYLFDFSPRLQEFYRGAAIAITRAGAMTIAELEENRVPAILIPLPTAAENHQYYNAVEQQRKGFAMVMEQKALDRASLLSAIETMYNERDKYVDALAKLPRNTAAADIGAYMISTLEKGR